jgi:DNA-binding MarR family transcriptional regulator
MKKKNKSHSQQAKLHDLAQELEQHLTVIRHEVRRPVEAEFAKGGLTGPQRSVMQAVVHSDGRSLKELSAQVGLAHSTVSGIVDRLAKRGMLRRQPNPTDRRHTRIVASREVRDFLEKHYPVIAANPLLKMLRRTTPSERDAVVRGVRVLRRLLETRADKKNT